MDGVDRAESPEVALSWPRPNHGSDIATGFAYELNNQLTAIVGHADLLQDELGAGQGSALGSIIEAAQRAAKLVQQLQIANAYSDHPPRVLDAMRLLHDLQRRLVADVGNVTIYGNAREVPVYCKAVLLEAALESLLSGFGSGAVPVSVAIAASDSTAAAGRVLVGATANRDDLASITLRWSAAAQLMPLAAEDPPPRIALERAVIAGAVHGCGGIFCVNQERATVYLPAGGSVGPGRAPRHAT